jgi:hypothetical protein
LHLEEIPAEEVYIHQPIDEAEEQSMRKAVLKKKMNLLQKKDELRRFCSR